MIARRWLLGAAIVAIAIALLAVRPHSTPGPLLRDFEAYYAGGATWNSGNDPYGRDVWRIERHVPGVDASRDELLPFVGPPYALPVFALFSRMPYSIAVRLWSSVLGLALVATILLALRLCGIRYGAPSIVAGAAFALGFAPITSDLALGQVALLAYAGALLAIVSIEWRAVFPAFGIVVAALQPNVALPLAVLLTRRRGIALLAAGIVATLAAALAAGAPLLAAYPRTIAAHNASEVFLAIQQTPASIAFGFGASPAFARVLESVVAIAALVAGAIAVMRARLLQHRFAIACAFVPLISAFFHEHDLLVAFAPALWCARHARGRFRDLAVFATILVAVDWLGLAQRPDGVAQSALLAFAAACAFTSLRDEATPWRGVLAAAAVFCGGAAAGVVHPAPIWPDAMGAFHASPFASAAEVWLQEQTRSGLASADSWWALLRTLALCGSAVLAYTTTKSPPEDGDFAIETRRTAVI